MVQDMMEIGLKIGSKDKESGHTLMIHSTKVSGCKIEKMDMELCIRIISKNFTKVNGKMVCNW